MTGHTLNKPQWLRKTLLSGRDFRTIHEMMEKHNLHTVCREAACPNRWECGAKKTATFLISGPYCTRRCRFCNIAGKPPVQVDPGEPERVAQLASDMGLTYVVVTSVTRDDLPDGGAEMFSRTIQALRKKISGVRVEVLIPDFKGDQNALEVIVSASPDVINHNVETVPRLYPAVRPGADYARSIGIIRRVAVMDSRIVTKSGMMLGMSEQESEVETVLADLVDAGCRLFTMGQYLAPSKNHWPVSRYVPPEEFDAWQKLALEAGFSRAVAGPFVRSSFNAGEMFFSTLFNLP